ncbi:MAG: ROK family protein [candidate division WOR-3 bacterium]
MSWDIGVDIGGTNIKVGVVDSRGRIVARRNLKTMADQGPHQALERLGQTILALRRGKRVASVGIGIAGLVDHKAGVVRLPPNLPGWHGTPVKKTIEDLTGLRVYCANDVNAVTLAEWLFGAGRGCKNLFCLTLGTGCGGGIIADGRPLIGANHAAAELGHTIIFGDGPQCRCGGQGCLECYVGAASIVERAKRKLRSQMKRLAGHKNQIALFNGMESERPSLLFDMAGGNLNRLTTKEIGKAARAGDRLALQVVDETGFYLGLGIANVVALIDPERIVIGGGVSRIGPPLLQAVKQTVFGRIPIFSGRKLEIVLSELGTDAGIIGASQLRQFLG